MKPGISLFAIAGACVLFVVGSATFYTVDETEQVVITQFGKIVGETVKEAGLHMKTPFIQKINRFEDRVLEWDGPTTLMPTKDKVYVQIDCFGRWRIKDARLYLEQLRDETTAHSRLNTVLNSATLSVIAAHDFIEAVRTTKDRKAVRDGVATSITDSRIGVLPGIKVGRSELEKQILAAAAPAVVPFGIELLDVRFKRINYNESVSRTIYQRMISERTQIAERFRSEGAGEAAKILGQRERDLKTIESEAYRKVQEIEGAADAKATEIYAKAYNKTPQAAELFEFLKTMEAYKLVITPDTNLILSTDSHWLRYLKSPDPAPTGAAGGALGQDTLLKGLPSLMDIARP